MNITHKKLPQQDMCKLQKQNFHAWRTTSGFGVGMLSPWQDPRWQKSRFKRLRGETTRHFFSIFF